MFTPDAAAEVVGAAPALGTATAANASALNAIATRLERTNLIFIPASKPRIPEFPDNPYQRVRSVATPRQGEFLNLFTSDAPAPRTPVAENEGMVRHEK